MRDDPEFNIHFVGLVKKFPELYDLFLPEYSNRNKVENAWREISNQVKYPTAACKKRWKNIRCGMIRCVRNQPTDGTSQRKPYYLANHLEFLLPFMKPRNRSALIVIEDEEEMEENIRPDTPASNSTSMQMSLDEIDSTEIEPSHIPEAATPTVDRVYSLKRKNVSAEVAETHFSSKQCNLSEDGLEEFVLSMVPQMRKFSLAQQLRCKEKLLKVVHDIALE